MKGRKHVSIYVTSYEPLIHNQWGKKASKTYNIPPFVDRSCRREPDFEAQYPGISAICRGRLFAPRLRENDIVVYITTKGINKAQGWHLSAILQIIQRFESHESAASWYHERSIPLPNNCMIEGNPPVDLDRTSRKVQSLRAWDAKYKQRTRDCPVFLICKVLYKELYSPPLITEDMMKIVFGKELCTRNPPKITYEQYHQLREISGISDDAV
jgi:hypothetical protein